MFPLFAPVSYSEEKGGFMKVDVRMLKATLKENFQIDIIYYFLLKCWLKEEKLISVSVILRLQNNKLNKCLNRHRGFVFFRGNDMNAAPSANISHPVLFGDVFFLTRQRLGLYMLQGKQHQMHVYKTRTIYISL